MSHDLITSGCPYCLIDQEVFQIEAPSSKTEIMPSGEGGSKDPGHHSSTPEKEKEHIKDYCWQILDDELTEAEVRIYSLPVAYFSLFISASHPFNRLLTKLNRPNPFIIPIGNSSNRSKFIMMQ